MSKPKSKRRAARVEPTYDVIVVDDTLTDDETYGGIKYTPDGQAGADVYKTVVVYFDNDKDDRAKFGAVCADGAVHLMIGGDEPADLPVFKRWVKKYVADEMPALYRRVRREYTWALRAEARARALKHSKDVAPIVDAKSVWGEMEVETILYDIQGGTGVRFHSADAGVGPVLQQATYARPAEVPNSIFVEFTGRVPSLEELAVLPFTDFIIVINAPIGTAERPRPDHPNVSFITVANGGVVDVLVESVLAVRRAELWFQAGKVAPNHLPDKAGVKDVAQALLEAGVVPPLQ